MGGIYVSSTAQSRYCAFCASSFCGGTVRSSHLENEVGVDVGSPSLLVMVR